MNHDLELVINKLTSSLVCSKQEKSELQHELRDHLYSALEQYIESGYSEEEATKLVIHNFGQTDKLAKQYQHIVNPVFGLFKRFVFVMFCGYSIVVFWKLILARLITRMIDYSNYSNQYYNVFIERLPSELQTNRFFNFSMWEQNINLIPLQTISYYFTNPRGINQSIVIDNLVGNIILFIPFGLFMILLFSRLHSLSRIVVLGLFVSLGLELLQFTLQVGIADVDDVILNVIGTVIGYFAAKGILKLLFTTKFHLSKNVNV